jgi:hypothetical protein
MASLSMKRALAKRTIISLVCVCGLVSTCSEARVIGGPLLCKWVFFSSKWNVSSLAAPKEFLRIQTYTDHSRVPKDFSFEILKNYFQNEKDASRHLTLSELHWDRPSRADHDQGQLPYRQCSLYGSVYP